MLYFAYPFFASGLYDGCCYLAGYVVELALKARICKVLDLTDYPETGEISRSFKTHKLDDLIRLAGLQRKFDAAKAANPRLLTNWSLVTEWTEDFRYKPVGSSPRIRAEEIIVALEDQIDGVFTWIKNVGSGAARGHQKTCLREPYVCTGHADPH